jgi:hypothetical protein
MNSHTVINAFTGEFRRYRRLSEEAMAQVSARDLYARINPMQNSIAAIVQLMHNNMIWRWTNFLSIDGQPPELDRDVDFAERGLDRHMLMTLWHRGWQRLFDALQPLTDADLGRVVKIRDVPHTAAMAIATQLAHCAWYAGQIALIARHVVGEEWRYLTVLPGGEDGGGPVGFHASIADLEHLFVVPDGDTTLVTWARRPCHR